MFLISFSIFWSIFSDSSRLSPINWRCGIFIRSFFFLVSASLFHRRASVFSCVPLFPSDLPFLPFFFARGGFFCLA